MALIITGHDRSGTTLVRTLCNQHPEMAITDEFGSFSPTGLSYRKYARRMLRWRAVQNRYLFDRDYTNGKLRRYSNLLFNTTFLLRLFEYRRSKITAASVEAALHKMYPQSKVVGDKRTLYMADLNRLLSSDDLSGIIVYRDCRDVTSSFLTRAKADWKDQEWAMKMNTAAAVARRWVKYIKVMEQAQGRLYTIRYENLVQEPQAELAALGTWLGVAPDGFSYSDVRANGIGKYRKGLTEDELNEVLEIAGPTMARYGYVQ